MSKFGLNRLLPSVVNGAGGVFAFRFSVEYLVFGAVDLWRVIRTGNAGRVDRFKAWFKSWQNSTNEPHLFCKFSTATQKRWVRNVTYLPQRFWKSTTGAFRPDRHESDDRFFYMYPSLLGAVRNFLLLLILLFLLPFILCQDSYYQPILATFRVFSVGQAVCRRFLCYVCRFHVEIFINIDQNWLQRNIADLLTLRTSQSA